MAPDQRPARPLLKTADTLDANELSGSLDTDGYAKLQSNGFATTNGTTNRPGALKIALDNAKASQPRDDSPDSTDSKFESYDSQTPHPDTIKEGSSGGQVEVDIDEQTARRGLARRGSIPIRLERTDKKGRYLLTADDPEIRDILTRGLQRRNEAESRKSSTSKLRELVFTRRFTAFDRQNPSNFESPFLGFYVLFWIAMALLLVRIAGQNYRVYGNVLGQNQLLRMMFGREIISMGLTDTAMFGLTSFGLGLQLLIYKGYLTW